MASVTINCPTCCNGTSGFTFMCRNRGGVATLCGWPEYNTPSSPPKKYKVRTLSGGRTQSNYYDTLCANISDNITETYSGTCSYDPSAACALTDASVWRQVSSSQGTITSQRCDITKFAWESFVLTQTSKSVPLSSGCHTFQNFGVQTFACTIAETLSSEDTESDAIGRLNLTWPDWPIPPAMSCATAACCTANWELRGPNQFSFVYSEAEFKIAGTAPQGTIISVSIDIMRAPYGTNLFTLFQTISYDDLIGPFEVVDTVPNQVGYTTYATNPVISIL